MYCTNNNQIITLENEEQLKAIFIIAHSITGVFLSAFSLIFVYFFIKKIKHSCINIPTAVFMLQQARV